MRTGIEIQRDINEQLRQKAEYYTEHPTGTDGTGGFFCATQLNLLIAELAVLSGRDSEDLYQEIVVRRNK